MGFKEKLKNGFIAKPRTPQEIDTEYQHHAMNIGHKLDGIRDLEEQLEVHRQALPKLKAEMAAAQKAIRDKAKKAAPQQQQQALPPQAAAVPAPQTEQQVSP